MTKRLHSLGRRTFVRSALVAMLVAAVLVAVVSLSTRQASATSSVGGPITRSEVIARAQNWFSRNLTYCCNDGSRPPSKFVTDVDGAHKYGPDCSGLVSMAWHVNPGSAGGYNTSSLPDVSTKIADRSTIQQGDLLLDLYYVNGVLKEHHAILFDTWQPDHVHFSYYSFGSTPMRHYDGGTSNTHGPLGSFASGTTLAGYDQSHYQAYQYNNIIVGGIGNPVVAINSDGRLEVFHWGSDGALWHAYQLTPGGGWSRWSSLGGTLASVPAVRANDDGRLEAFVRGTNSVLYHAWQLTAGSSSWSGWYSMGGVVGGFTGVPAMGVNTDGRLEVFARGFADDALYHAWQLIPGGGWSGWSSLGGVLTSSPTVEINLLDGRLEAFVRGTDSALYHTYQLTAGNSSWSGWSSLGGLLTSDPVVQRNIDWRLEMFARGADGTLKHTYQLTAGSSTWSAWSSLGGGLVFDPAIGSNPDGRLEAFVRGTDGTLKHAYQLTAGSSTWSAWSSLGGGLDSEPVVAANADGRLEVFVRGTDEAIYHIWQVTAGGGWSQWYRL